MKCPSPACGWTSHGYCKFCQNCATRMVETSTHKKAVLCLGKLEDNSPCQAMLRESQNFCQDCGTKVNPKSFIKKQTVRFCRGKLSDNSACQAVMTPSQRFCHECGTKVERGPLTNGTKTSSKSAKSKGTRNNVTSIKARNIAKKPRGDVSKTKKAKEPAAGGDVSVLESMAENTEISNNDAAEMETNTSTEKRKATPAKPPVAKNIFTITANTSTEKRKSIAAKPPVAQNIGTRRRSRGTTKVTAKEEEKDTGVMLYCYPCKIAFTSEYHFDRHTKYRHSMSDIKTDKHMSGDQEMKVIEDEHIQGSPKSPEDEDSSTPKKRRVSNRKIFECTVCGKTLKSAVCYQSHMNNHSGVKPYSCRICDTRFYDSATLAKHEKRHTGTKKCLCKTCGKLFFLVSELRLHVVTHTRERKFPCQSCDKRFLQRAHLDKHVKHMHIKERTHSCEVCGKCFFDKYVLNTHKKIHDDIRAYKCDQCDKAFVDGSNYRAHLRVHTGVMPYCCITCNKKFARSMDLKIHQSVHTDAKYKCTLCGIHCRTESGIKSHILQHRNIKPFACQYCERKYMRNSNLQEHVKNHHSSEVEAETEFDDCLGRN